MKKKSNPIGKRTINRLYILYSKSSAMCIVCYHNDYIILKSLFVNLMDDFFKVIDKLWK